METYVECMVKKKANGLMSALKVLLIGIAVITGLLGFMGLIVFLIIAVVAGVGAYFVSLNANLEYEYLYVDKQLTVELTPAAKDQIIEAAYDPIYGARPLRRYLQHTVETLISRKIVSDQVEPGSRITVECRDGELTVDSREVLTGEVVDG